MELTGSSVFDYVHPGDHAELAEQLGMKLPPTRMMSPSSSSTPSVAEGSPSTATSPGLQSPVSPQGGFILSKFVVLGRGIFDHSQQSSSYHLQIGLSYMYW